LWDGWDNYLDDEDAKRYQLIMGSDIQILIGAYLTKLNSSWKVEIVAFSPGAGEYVDYEDTFESFQEAEANAWREAQDAVKARQDLH